MRANEKKKKGIRIINGRDYILTHSQWGQEYIQYVSQDNLPNSNIDCNVAFLV